MGLNTEVKDGGGLPKVIQPGENVFKINSVELLQLPWMEKDKGYSVVMQCESKPIEGFQGFFIDPANESLGRHLGQVGKIKTTNWPYKDGVTKGGTVVKRDDDIMVAINRICKAVGSTWLKDVNNKYNTIEELVEGFNADAPFADKFIRGTIACREYNRPGKDYPGQDLFLPKGKMGHVVIEAEDAKISKLLPFNEADHYERYVAEETEEFKGDEATGIDGEPIEEPEFDI